MAYDSRDQVSFLMKAISGYLLVSCFLLKQELSRVKTWAVGISDNAGR